jgi:hypothetical protein
MRVDKHSRTVKPRAAVNGRRDSGRAKHSPTATNDRAALLISCSQQDVQVMRERAREERRQISSYLVNVMMTTVEFDEKLLAKYGSLAKLRAAPPSQRTDGPRAAVLLRCSEDEARRIRGAAKRRDMTISGYVRYVLRRSWEIADKRREMMHARLVQLEAIERQVKKTTSRPPRVA